MEPLTPPSSPNLVWECTNRQITEALSNPSDATETNNNSKTNSNAAAIIQLPIFTDIQHNIATKESCDNELVPLDRFNANRRSTIDGATVFNIRSEDQQLRDITLLRFSSQFYVNIDALTSLSRNNEEGLAKLDNIVFGEKMPPLLRRVNDGTDLSLKEVDFSGKLQKLLPPLLSPARKGRDNGKAKPTTKAPSDAVWHFVILRAEREETSAAGKDSILCSTTLENGDYCAGFVEFRADVLVAANQDNQLLSILNAVKEAMVWQVIAFKIDLSDYLVEQEINDLNAPISNPVMAPLLCRSCHFQPWGNSGPHVTVQYLLERQFVNANGDDELIVVTDQESSGHLFKKRTALHKSLCLPMDRPLLRCGLALFDPFHCIKSKHHTMTQQPLTNVHLEILPFSMIREKMLPSSISSATIRGSYRYYHYMQQDDGDVKSDVSWGCAYRSLQTIHSWYELNGFTDKATPTITEIQQCLVNLGDKPKSFVRSREWIGSVEVGYVLNELLGVECRSFNVNSGPDVARRSQEILNHFETQETPIMMGGGNLALTILGIDWNEVDDECMLLILDPHYDGEDDLDGIKKAKIKMGGYKAVPCGWRKPSTLTKGSFYQVCLPSRPRYF